MSTTTSKVPTPADVALRPVAAAVPPPTPLMLAGPAPAPTLPAVPARPGPRVKIPRNLNLRRTAAETGAAKPVPSELCYVEIDAATAATWLEGQGINRSMRDGAVNKYVEDMKHGRWPNTGESIKFDRDGRMLDGQHRLQAILETGITLRMVVVPGLDPAAQFYMDTGMVRRPSDALALRGESSTTALASLARIVILYDRTRLTVMGTPVSTGAILEWVEGNKKTARGAIDLAVSLRNNIRVPGSVLAFCAWQFRSIDVEAADGFLHDVAYSRTGGPAWRTGEDLARLMTTVRGQPVRLPEPV